MNDAKRWKLDITNPKGKARFWLSLIIGWTVGALFIALAIGLHKPASFDLSHLENAKSAYVISTTPSKKLLKHLEAAHEKGCIVRLITSTPTTTSFKTKTISKDKIPKNAILINSSEWYPLP